LITEIKSNAMFELGNYYKIIEKNYNEMKLYYLMAIEYNNLNAMNELCGYYYEEIESDYSEKSLILGRLLEYVCYMSVDDIDVILDSDLSTESKRLFLRLIQNDNDLFMRVIEYY